MYKLSTSTHSLSSRWSTYLFTIFYLLALHIILCEKTEDFSWVHYPIKEWSQFCGNMVFQFPLSISKSGKKAIWIRFWTLRWMWHEMLPLVALKAARLALFETEHCNTRTYLHCTIIERESQSQAKWYHHHHHHHKPSRITGVRFQFEWYTFESVWWRMKCAAYCGNVHWWGEEILKSERLECWKLNVMLSVTKVSPWIERILGVQNSSLEIKLV